MTPDAQQLQRKPNETCDTCECDWLYCGLDPDSCNKLPEYIITGFQLKQLQGYADLEFICQAIRTRPHTPQAPEQHLFWIRGRLGQILKENKCLEPELKGVMDKLDEYIRTTAQEHP